MVLTLITPEEQKRIFLRLMDYYKKLYPNILFKQEEKVLSKKDIADVYYTYPGEEEQASASDKMALIAEEISAGYSTPVILLRRKSKLIVLDGHRRLHVAFDRGMSWKAFIISPQKDAEFGIEKMVLGKIKELFGRKRK